MSAEFKSEPLPPGEGDLGRLTADFSPLGITTDENSYAIRVEGNAMDGAGIHDGDTVLVNHTDAKDGDSVVVAAGPAVMIRRLQKDEQGFDVLRSANPKTVDVRVGHHVRFKGVVVGLVRRL
jgi:SOS-response transcriptional repressor LexA